MAWTLSLLLYRSGAKVRKEGMTVMVSRALKRLEFQEDERGLRELGKITETLTKG